jgi:23S rRNA pseudouridine1911/1915/1917 synthase
MTADLSSREQTLIRSAGRQMLHAWRLQFIHPVTGFPVQFESPLPLDMAAVIETLREGGGAPMTYQSISAQALPHRELVK